MPPTKEDDEEPAKKKAKLDAVKSKPKIKHQASLSSFFSAKTKPKPIRPSKLVVPCSADASKETQKLTQPNTEKPATDNASAKAIVPTQVPSSSAGWQSLYGNFVMIRKPRLKGFANEPHRQKVAAFDMDGTLVNWVGDFWPSKLAHYELWNSSVISKMQHLYDKENFLLVVFTNQGGIQGAHGGKKATLLKAILDWLESLVQRPLIVVASTKSLKKYKDQSFHKPTPKMWDKVLKPYFGKKSAPFDTKASFFVGDSVGEDDPQGGVDEKFAESAGGGLGAFYTPDDYFGPSHQELRKRRSQLGGGDAGVPEIPSTALDSRKALLGGYHSSEFSSDEKPQPILILLVGVQGAGKSTFCHHVLFGKRKEDADDTFINKNKNWVSLSQDTINNGKPGKREKVEEEARKELRNGNSVLLDRMHLNPEERQDILESVVTPDLKARVQIHVVVLNPSKEVVTRRVKNRTNHPGKVEGEKGVRFALKSLGAIVMPTYKEEQFRLISYASTGYAATQLALRYHYNSVDKISDGSPGFQLAKNVPALTTLSTLSEFSIPAISLGTMKIGRRICIETVQKMVDLGFHSIDTAPTYKNEDKIGEVLQTIDKSDSVFIIAKVPKKATTAEEVQTEFARTLQELKKPFVDLLLLHWPSDVIAQNTLPEVWNCMEELVKEKKCRALGVCNFNEAALTLLLRSCTIPPVVNQVERHPLLPQFALLEFCARHNIWMQAHSPFGGSQGAEQILKHPVVEQVAKETDMSPAQVVLRWNLQQGVLVVTKCSQESHAKEILSCTSDDPKMTETKLSPKHMKALDALGSIEKKRKRFVAPPFMYGTKGIYCWGERMPFK